MCMLMFMLLNIRCDDGMGRSECVCSVIVVVVHFTYRNGFGKTLFSIDPQQRRLDSRLFQFKFLENDEFSLALVAISL